MGYIDNNTERRKGQHLTIEETGSSPILQIYYIN